MLAVKIVPWFYFSFPSHTLEFYNISFYSFLHLSFDRVELEQLYIYAWATKQHTIHLSCLYIDRIWHQLCWAKSEVSLSPRSPQFNQMCWRAAAWNSPCALSSSAAKQKKKRNGSWQENGKFMLAGALFRIKPNHNSLLLFQKFPTKFS